MVERIGDEAEALKNGKYKALVESQDLRFSPLVFYSLGGWHKSALSFVKVMASALDEQACLLSRAEWKKQAALACGDFVCYFVFDWWGVSTAIQIRLYAGLLSVLPLWVGAKAQIGYGIVAVCYGSVWGSLLLVDELQSAQSGVCLAVDGHLGQEGSCGAAVE